jgi:WD40 repeat protein
MPGRVGMVVAHRYLLAEAIGQGGMGRVWRGHDQLLDRVVAVKEVILRSQSPDERAGLLARTMREARAAARLDHPGVVTIHDVVEHEGSPWIVMQFLAGISLQARIEQEGRLPWQEVAEAGRQVAEALTVAHAAGIVHRDLKPDNILLSDGRAIVTDFGIARIMDSTTQLTHPGILVGTPAYMSPEQLDGGGIGPAGDLWALGATLYTAVEGTPPFVGGTMPALIAAILLKTPSPPRHADPALWAVVARLLAKDPAERPDAVAAARALAACRSGEIVQDRAASSRIIPSVQWPSAARTETAFTPTPVPTPPGNARLVRRRRWRLTVAILSVAGVLAAAAAGTAGLLADHNHSPGTAASTTRPPASQRPSATALNGPVAASLLAILPDPAGKSADSIAFGPDGTLAVGDFNGTTYLWNISAKAVIDRFHDQNGQGVDSVAFSSNDTLAVGDVNGSTYLWSIPIQNVIDTFTVPNGQQVISVASGSGGALAVGDYNGSTYLWNATTNNLIGTLPGPGGGAYPADVAFGPESILAVADFISGPAGADRGTVYVWNTTTKKVIAIFHDPGGRAPVKLAFGPDGTLAVGDENGSTYLWNPDAKSVRATLSASHGQGYPAAVAFGPDGILAIADTSCTGACYGGTVPSAVYLWRIATKKVIATIPIPEGVPPDSLAWGPGDSVAIGATNGTTYVWRISNAKA